MRTPLYWVFNCLWIFCGVVKIAEAEIIALVPSFMWTPSFWSWNCSRLSWRIDFQWLLEIESAIFLIGHSWIRDVLLLSKFGATGEVFGLWPDWLFSSRNDYQVTSSRAGLSHYFSQLAWRNLVTNSAGFHSFNSSWSTLRFGTCTRHQSPIDRSGWIPLKACSKVEFQIVIYNDLKGIQS